MREEMHEMEPRSDVSQAKQESSERDPWCRSNRNRREHQEPHSDLKK
jgi:hypothetical protein